ncbi:MAG: hypothetical protein EPN79_16135 [Burkholderiaceae bacterium]|nr:MAG: hypothetical protein EPN79_16135 [Burkholderiaceae bacterium]
MRKILPASALALLLAGCVTTGTKIDPTVVNHFKPGVTTVADAEAALGQPNQVEQLSDGSTVLTYNFAHAASSGSSYIPIVGAFTGHTDVQSQDTSLTFNAAGKFVKSAIITGQNSARMFGN